MPEMIAATLGLSPPWQVSSVTFADKDRRLDITLSYTSAMEKVCPRCGARGTSCDAGIETWFHQDFFRYSTYLHAQVPQITCCGRSHTVERPWARAGSKFVKICDEQ